MTGELANTKWIGIGFGSWSLQRASNLYLVQWRHWELPNEPITWHCCDDGMCMMPYFWWSCPRWFKLSWTICKLIYFELLGWGWGWILGGWVGKSLPKLLSGNLDSVSCIFLWFKWMVNCNLPWKHRFHTAVVKSSPKHSWWHLSVVHFSSSF